MYGPMQTKQPLLPYLSVNSGAATPEGRQVLSAWFGAGLKMGAKYVVVCRGYTLGIFEPHYIYDEARLKVFLGNYLYKICEIYSVHKNLEEQLCQRRAWSVPKVF